MLESSVFPLFATGCEYVGQRGLKAVSEYHLEVFQI